MSFYERFELLDLVADQGIKTFEARESATGRSVLVHLFVAPKAPLQAALLKALDQMPEAERKRILDRGRTEGTPYVVTDGLGAHKTFQEWVLSSVQQSAATPGSVAGPVSPVIPAPSQGKSGRVFQVPPAARPSMPAAIAPVVPVRPAAVVSAPIQSPRPAANPASQQTSLQESIQEMLRASEVEKASQRAPQSAPRTPGEFTRMFMSRNPVKPAPAARPSAEPGEFTRMFQSSNPPAGLSASADAADVTTFVRAPHNGGPESASPTVPASFDNRAGEFTRIFAKSEMQSGANLASAPVQQSLADKVSGVMPKPATPSLTTQAADPLIAETPEAHEVQLPQAQSELTGADEMLEAFNVLPKPAAPSFAIRAEDPLVGVTSGAPKVQLPQINSELRGADNELEKIAEAPGAGKTMPPILGIAAVILVAVLTLLYFTLGKH